MSLAGQGLRDLTRIAESDPRLWEQIVSSNAVAVLAGLDAVVDDLEVVRDELLRRVAAHGARLSCHVRRALSRQNDKSTHCRTCPRPGAWSSVAEPAAPACRASTEQPGSTSRQSRS